MSITLDPKLQSKLDQTAEKLGKLAEEIASEAIRTHLEELDADAIDEEERAYQRLYPELREQYPQQYVAIYEGRVIDSDPDFEELFVRIKKQLGDRVVLMRRVGDSPVEEYNFRSPRME
jgi:predicted DNA-binding protein